MLDGSRVTENTRIFFTCDNGNKEVYGTLNTCEVLTYSLFLCFDL